jgi:SagB-type dehydrogenase family enzyme
VGNGDLAAAWEYHQRTRHSIQSLRANRHQLAWEIQPLPYKIYTDLAPIPLPREWRTPPLPALTAIADGTRGPMASRTPSLDQLARLLLLAAGITRKSVYANGQEMYFRAAACTGALYHIDLYLVCGELPGLEAGVYHFGPHDFALRRLRAGDHRGALLVATGDAPEVAAAPLVVVCASTFWRNAWKYQARTYRHCFWDAGTILANALAAAHADDLPAHLLLGFVDARVEELLDLDATREAALALLTLGHDAAAVVPPAPAPSPLALRTVPLSTHEVDYPEIRAAHQASALVSPAEVAAWRGAPPAIAVSVAAGPTTPLTPPVTAPADDIDAVIRRRGSTRVFAREPITLAQLSTVLAVATGAIPADFLAASDAHLCDLHLIVHAVDGLEPGTYVYRRGERALERLRAGSFRHEAGALGLGQDLPADASVNVYLLTDLRPVLARFGNRGYRAAQLEAAITGGRLYLAAYALGLGATGLTFLDDAVVDFFAPHAAGKSVMFLAAIGRGRRSTRHDAKGERAQ